MDIVTHTLLGATAGYALGGQRVGRSAVLAGALGASLPDLDILLRNSTDPLFALEFHRHFSHSLLFAVIASVGVGLILNRLFKRGGIRLNIMLVLIGYLSAILLDACTSYGTQLFWPFSDQRVALSIISILDPILSVVLILSLIIGLVRRTTRTALFALAFCVCYLGIGALQQHRVRILFQEATASLLPAPTHHLLKPSFGNIILWRGLAWNDQEIVSAAIRPGFLSRGRVYAGERRPRPDAEQLRKWSGGSSIVQSDVRRFARLSSQLLIVHPSRPSMLGDARFALLPDSLEPLWGIEVNASGDPEHVDYVTNRNMTDARRVRFTHMLLGRDLP